ncbi:MAG: hypothetical protein WCR01_09155 [Bacteroidota bacterium]
MKRFSIFLLLIGFNAFQATAQQLDFVREKAEFKLGITHLEVTAELWFKNPTNKTISQTMHIPFACDGSDYANDSLTILDCTTNTCIKPIRKNIAGALIQVTVNAQEQKKIRVSYIQNHDGKRAGYIITKIKYWNKPLAEGNYTLLVESPSIRIDSTSYKPDNISTEDGKIKETWRKYNFSPTKELCIHFHVE